ncbi:hypothetical protein N7517_011286 [Penicillium concentricum]|uniref:Uncharacterized protein n=1 Tax=Penicillium concentricum TaxID=293559 RepID=A0A9W9RAL3_9EURO|nr:uncharacterized protein N7517_011286 [Penicillium concentricum]KAJ5356677.1 hypothetical protein N7517_011286 [Penicillium concentricum]
MVSNTLSPNEELRGSKYLDALLNSHEARHEARRKDPDTSVIPCFTEENSFLFRPQIYIPILVLIYTVILLAAWWILCLLSNDRLRPIPSSRGHSYDSREPAAYEFSDTIVRWCRAALVLWSITGVVKLPLTSAVCGL